MNWWFNELRVPARMADTALLFGPWITSAHTKQIMVKYVSLRDTHAWPAIPVCAAVNAKPYARGRWS